MIKSGDPDRTALKGTVQSGSTLFASHFLLALKGLSKSCVYMVFL